MWPHDQMDMWLGKGEPVNISHHCAKLDAYRCCESGDVMFFTVIWHHVTTWSKAHMSWQKGAPKPISPLYQVWCFHRSSRSGGRYNVFPSSIEIMWPQNQSYI